jgi:NAD(P)-dependent dehydrogenase (short-subunit alcohol dehydrogenase family)
MGTKAMSSKIPENLFDLSGKIAMITGAGANGGIGHALALGFSRYGATVIAADD